MINYAVISLSFLAGVGIFFSPCGVALIPAYISFLLGRKSEATSVVRRGVSGFKIGVIVSLGILTVFLSTGVLISVFGNFLAPYAFWFGAGTGILLIILGIFMFAGRTLTVYIPHNFKTKNHSSLTFYLFGVGYAIGGIACTLPAFLFVVFAALGGDSILANIANFIAFSAGTVLLMIAITTIAAISQVFIERVILSKMFLIHRIVSVVVIIAGVYLIYFNMRAFIF